MGTLATNIKLVWLIARIKMISLAAKFPPLPGGVLDEQTRWLREGQKTLGERPLNSTTPRSAREAFNNSIGMLKLLGGYYAPVFTVRDLEIPGPAGMLAARLYLPDGKKRYPLFVYFHGGGWVLGGLESGDNIARFLCNRGKCAVLSVDYRLAPEHPFPAAVEDALAAVKWAADNASELSVDTGRLVVGGDSAGGTLSAVVTQLARRDGLRLAGQFLFYPGTDCANLDTQSYKDFGDGEYGLPQDDVEWFLDQYAPIPMDRRDPRLSPLMEADLGGLPPAVVVTAEFDVLRDEGEAYARKLVHAGVQVVLLRCNGMIHGFLNMIGLLNRATMYFDQVIVELKRLTGS